MNVPNLNLRPKSAKLVWHVEWRVESLKSRMSDKDIKYATAIAKDRDHNIEARLQIGCLEHNLVPPESPLRARARGKNNAALPLECRKMDLHPVITGFLLAIIFAAFLIVGFVS